MVGLDCQLTKTVWTIVTFVCNASVVLWFLLQLRSNGLLLRVRFPFQFASHHWNIFPVLLKRNGNDFNEGTACDRSLRMKYHAHVVKPQTGFPKTSARVSMFKSRTDDAKGKEIFEERIVRIYLLYKQEGWVHCGTALAWLACHKAHYQFLLPSRGKYQKPLS